MDNNKLISLIDLALKEVDNIIANSKYYQHDKEPMLSVIKVLTLLKENLHKNPDSINKRILRGMHDLGVASYREFANTQLEKTLDNITSMLYYEMPGYSELEPLRGDFGKGNPI